MVCEFAEGHRLRFWEKVEFTPSCWIWTGATDGHGYGHLTLHSVSLKAYRVAYEFVRGGIPQGLELDHTCENKLCVNPAHLEAVTHQVNIARATVTGYCMRGHEFTPENTVVNSQKHGTRTCRICRREREVSYLPVRRARAAAEKAANRISPPNPLKEGA